MVLLEVLNCDVATGDGELHSHRYRHWNWFEVQKQSIMQCARRLQVA